jgi:hypothetical protein
MSQVDPWEKTAECTRAIQISTDPLRKDVLTNLQHMWITLANKRNFLTPEERAREAEKIAGSMLCLVASTTYNFNSDFWTQPLFGRVSADTVLRVVDQVLAR